MATKGSGGMSTGVRLTVEVPKGLAQFIRDLGNFGGSKISLKSWAEREMCPQHEEARISRL